MALDPLAFKDDRFGLEVVNPGNPAVGNPLQWSIPSNRVGHIVFVQFSLVTSANVGDRLPLVYMGGSGGINGPYSPSPLVQAASLTWTYYFSMGIAPVDYSTNFQMVFAVLGCCYFGKSSTDQLVINANGLDPLDQIQGIYIRYHSWKEE